MCYRIAICGIDGSGKTTLIQKLYNYYSTMISTKIAKVDFHCKVQCKQAFSKKLNNFSFNIEENTIKRIGMAFEFINYYEKFDNFNGLLICDRYDICYQVLNRVDNIKTKYIELIDSLYSNIKEADLYIYLNASVQIASQHLDMRGNRNYDERDEILESMNQAYSLLLPTKKNVFTINASKTENEVFDEALQEINKYYCKGKYY